MNVASFHEVEYVQHFVCFINVQVIYFVVSLFVLSSLFQGFSFLRLSLGSLWNCQFSWYHTKLRPASRNMVWQRISSLHLPIMFLIIIIIIINGLFSKVINNMFLGHYHSKVIFILIFVFIFWVQSVILEAHLNISREIGNRLGLSCAKLRTA